MRYKLNFRKVTKDDFDRDCLFPPTEEDNEKDYKMYFDAIIDDIKNIDGVSNAEPFDDGSAVFVTYEASKEALEEQLKPFLSSFFHRLRLTNIEGPCK